MAGGCAAFALLVRPGAEGIESWFTATGVGHALLGLAIAAAFLLMGPTGIPGMQTSPGEVPKVAGLAFEANLFASLLGGIAPFALDRFRTRPGLGTASQAILLFVGMGLGVTRGAYLGLAAGLLVYLGVLAYRQPKRSSPGPRPGHRPGPPPRALHRARHTPHDQGLQERRSSRRDRPQAASPAPAPLRRGKPCAKCDPGSDPQPDPGREHVRVPDRPHPDRLERPPDQPDHRPGSRIVRPAP